MTTFRELWYNMTPAEKIVARREIEQSAMQKLKGKFHGAAALRSAARKMADRTIAECMKDCAMPEKVTIN